MEQLELNLNDEKMTCVKDAVNQTMKTIADSTYQVTANNRDAYGRLGLGMLKIKATYQAIQKLQKELAEEINKNEAIGPCLSEVVAAAEKIGAEGLLLAAQIKNALEDWNEGYINQA